MWQLSTIHNYSRVWSKNDINQRFRCFCHSCGLGNKLLQIQTCTQKKCLVENVQNAIFEPLDLKIFCVRMPTVPPTNSRLLRLLSSPPIWKYPPPSLCNSLLYGLPAKSLSKLQRVQSAAARLVAGTFRFSHFTPLLYSLHWLPVKEQIDYKIIILTFKTIYGFAPTYPCSTSQHLYHKSKACALIGQLAIFHLPICARQRKASSVNSLSGEV